MGFYSKYILPGLIEWACSNGSSDTKRAMVVPRAYGRVLEIGIGTGNNLPHYDGSQVSHLTAIDPMEALWKRNATDLSELPFDLTYIRGTASHIPAEAGTFDTVVTTFTLCSVDEADLVLKELRRVLKPGGKLIFYEHGKSPDKRTERWQNRVNPLWSRISGGCNLNRDIPALMEGNGFKTEDICARDTGGWKLISFSYWGTAIRTET